MADPPGYRLPRTVTPLAYRLELAPDLTAARFSGTATIAVRVEEATDHFVLNAADLEITGARLPGRRVDEVTLDAEAQRMTVLLGEPLPPGPAELTLEYEGTLNDKLRGFYLTTFTDSGGTERLIATTQFEPADARRAFPCWDEPDRKATFEITLVVDEALTAISNSRVESEAPAGPGRKRVRFAKTMSMSTYLVAFVVGPFEVTEPVVVDGVPIRIATPPGLATMTGFALEAAEHSLRFLSRYFDIPYPADKLDHVAIPDFAFGAMENLGCATYRETALLVDPQEASQLELRRVATVVAHETAHMWFGDLVTMKWWNGIWLNEAFATFMELTTTDSFRPEWDVWAGFASGRAAALATDGLRATRPVEFAVGAPEEAEAMFDVLTYQKGGAVLKMLEQYLGPSTFRKGISHYLAEHQHSNTETTDLWDAIEATSGEPVRATMDSWIFQGGHPVINVQTGKEPSSLVVTQQRFLYSAAPDDPAAQGRWIVPINLRASVAGTEQRQRLLLNSDRETISFDGPLDWVLVNDGTWGFYRVQYSPDLRRRLVDSLHDVCDSQERSSLFVDTWAGVLASMLPLSEWVALFAALEAEGDPDVWAAVLAPLQLLDLIVREPDRPRLQQLVASVARPMASALGWDARPGEPERVGVTRSRLIYILGALADDPSTQAEAAVRQHSYLAKGSGLDPDLRGAVAQLFARSGGDEAFLTLLDRYRSATNPQEKERCLFALAYSRQPHRLTETLDLCLSDEVRSQDRPFLVTAVMANRMGGRLAWDWVERHWQEILDRMPQNLVVRAFDGVTSLVEPDLVERVHRFFETHDIPVAEPRLAQLEERMDINSGFAGRTRDVLMDQLGLGG